MKRFELMGLHYSSRVRTKRLLQVIFILLVFFGLSSLINEWRKFSRSVNMNDNALPFDDRLFSKATAIMNRANGAGFDKLRVDLIQENTSILGEQGDLDYIAHNLIVHFKFLSTERAEIIFTNNGSRTIKNSGWAIYFSTMLTFSSMADSFVRSEDLRRDKLLRVSSVIGRLFKLTPVATNFMILPGESVRSRVGAMGRVSRFLVSPNWYIAAEGLQPRTVASTVGEELTFVSFPEGLQNSIHKTTPDLGHAPLAVIPTPKEFQTSQNNNGAEIKVYINREWTVCADDRLQNERRFLSDNLGLKESSITGPKSKVILLNLPSSFESGEFLNGTHESYNLQVDDSKEVITITGQGTAGVFYGIQTLLSLRNNVGEVPQVSVKDSPRFSYRGLMIDVARNFQTKRQILKILDVMAMYKMNKLHFHLSDSEGWRLEIPGLDELTTVGARRRHDLQEKSCLLPQFGSGPHLGGSGTGYYSTKDYREILRHAEQRHIQLIPEFDFPGHSHAAILSMLARYGGLVEKEDAESFLLSDLEDASRVLSVQGYDNDVINPCLTSTYKFLDHLVSVLVRLHRDIQPLTTFHFGGDEVPLGVWLDSPACRYMTQNMKRNGPLVRQHLMKHFIMKLSNITKKHGVDIAGWSDAFTGEAEPGPLDGVKERYVLSKTFLDTQKTVAHFWGDGNEVWRAEALMNNGYKVVFSPSDILYLDHSSMPNFYERGLNWATDYSDCRKILSYSPPENKNALGIEGCMWSELIRSADQMDSMIFPRLLALAERAWHKGSWEDNADDAARKQAIDGEWVHFANTLAYKELKRLDLMGVAYRIPPPEPRLICREYCNKLNVTTELPGLKIEYFTDDEGTWKSATPEMEVNGKMKFRTRSADHTRFSRVIEYERLQGF